MIPSRSSRGREHRNNKPKKQEHKCDRGERANGFSKINSVHPKPNNDRPVITSLVDASGGIS